MKKIIGLQNSLLSKVPFNQSTLNQAQYSGLQWAPQGGASKRVSEELFIRVCRDRTRENGFTLTEGRIRTDIRKKFFTVKHWNRLPREFMDILSLKVFKARLDRDLSNLVEWKVSLSMVGSLEQAVLSVLF